MKKHNEKIGRPNHYYPLSSSLPLLADAPGFRGRSYRNRGPRERISGEVDVMKTIIKAEIYYDGEYYCARCLDFDIFTQGKTLDELVSNLKEAILLHLEDDPELTDEYSSNPSLFTMMDLGELYA
jgi:predicted RNase H-like HicB family nuclease